MGELLVLCFRRFYRNSERFDPGLQYSQIGPEFRRGDTPDDFVERAFEPFLRTAAAKPASSSIVRASFG
jgi:hypothetical protein